MPKNKSAMVGYRVLLILLFLCAMNFQAKFFYILFTATAVAVLVFRNRRVDAYFFLYVFLAVLMMLYNIPNGLKAMFRCLAYPMAYYIGMSFFSLPRTNQNVFGLDISIAQKIMFQVLAVLASGAFAHYFCNLILNFGRTLGRNGNDIWSGEMLSATGQAALACLMVGLAVALIIAPMKKRDVILGVTAAVCVLVYNFMLAGRTLIIMMILVILVGLIYISKESRGTNKTFKIVAWTAVAFSIVIIVYTLNIGGMRDIIESSNLYMRFFGSASMDIAETSRLEAKLAFIKDMINYPLGGEHMHAKYGYAHDILLDAYDQYGIIVFALLFTIIVDGIRNVWYFCKIRVIDTPIRVAYLCTFCAMLLEFMVEPILNGMQWLFVCFCILNGVIGRTNKLYYLCGSKT